MLKVIGYLKSSLGAIMLVISFLILQAVCDFTLPEYTSNIVNIGIQQGGIETCVPKVLRESTYYKIKLFLKEEDKKILKSSYTVISKQNIDSENYNNYLKEYPSLVNEPLYILKNQNDVLNEILKKPIMSILSLESSKDFSDVLKKSLIEKKLITSENSEDIFSILAHMPSNAADSIVESIESKLDNMPDSIITQGTVEFIKMEYMACGVNIDNMQNAYILKCGSKMLFLALLSMISVVSVVFFASRVAAKLGRNLRKDVYKKVLYFSDEVFERFSTASLITRTTNDIIQVQTLLVMLLRMVFYAPILGAGGLIKVLDTNKSMTWTVGIALTAILIIVGSLFGFTIPKFKKVQTLVDKLNGVSREILTGLPVIRAFANEKYEMKRFDKVNEKLTAANLFVNRTMMIMMPSMMFIMNGVTALIVYAGSRSINDGLMQVGDLMAFIQYSMQIVMAFLMISMVSVLLPRALVCAKRVGEVLSAENTIKTNSMPTPFLEGKKGTVEFKNVSFAYPDSKSMALKNISFTAKRNKVTAIIGSTGSGKSTLVKLIPRLFDVTEGSVLVDGINVKSAHTCELRKRIGFIPQKTVLFSGSILSNIKFADENITINEVEKAVHVAQCSEFIQSKEKQYNYHIAQGGSNVSGGQKQRISIARAIAKNPEILIFDDSFSALDYKTDMLLRKELKARVKNCTYIIVAQRISTVMDADNIIVLDKGEIAGSGTHSELMKNCEVYRQIAYSQLSKEELEHEK